MDKNVKGGNDGDNENEKIITKNTHQREMKKK